MANTFLIIQWILEKAYQDNKTHTSDFSEKILSFKASIDIHLTGSSPWIKMTFLNY